MTDARFWKCFRSNMLLRSMWRWRCRTRVRLCSQSGRSLTSVLDKFELIFHFTLLGILGSLIGLCSQVCNVRQKHLSHRSCYCKPNFSSSKHGFPCRFGILLPIHKSLDLIGLRLRPPVNPNVVEHVRRQNGHVVHDGLGTKLGAIGHKIRWNWRLFLGYIKLTFPCRPWFRMPTF